MKNKNKENTFKVGDWVGDSNWSLTLAVKVTDIINNKICYDVLLGRNKQITIYTSSNGITNTMSVIPDDIIQDHLPNGHPDKVVKEPEFVLPEKWVLHVDIANLELAKSFIHNHKNDYKGYRGSWTISLDGIPCYLHYPQVPDSNAHSSFQIQKDYVEITTEQFKKYVLKEGELQQPSKDASIEEILEYCKKKYPLGTKIKCTKRYTESPYIDNGILTEICYINKGSNIIWAKGQSYFVCIYHDGNYAEIVEETKQESPIKLAEQGHKLYSLEELTKALTKEYDKIDVEDILKVIKTIK